MNASRAKPRDLFLLFLGAQRNPGGHSPRPSVPPCASPTGVPRLGNPRPSAPAPGWPPGPRSMPLRKSANVNNFLQANGAERRTESFAQANLLIVSLICTERSDVCPCAKAQTPITSFRQTERSDVCPRAHGFSTSLEIHKDARD